MTLSRQVPRLARPLPWSCLAWSCTVLLLAPARAQSIDLDVVREQDPISLPPCDPAFPLPPVYDRRVPLAAYASCGAFQTMPWAAAYAPDGTALYVSAFGGFIGQGGCSVLRLDPGTLAVEAEIMVAEGPEELAFKTAADGSMEYGFVSASSASSVVVFDRSDAVVETIALPFDPAGPFPTAFPFGLALSPDQSRLYVGTTDGSGNVFAIDTVELELVPGETMNFGADVTFGRMLFAGPELVIPTTEFHSGSSGSTAAILFVRPGAPERAEACVLASSSHAGRLPSAQDVALHCGNRLYVAGFDMGRRVFELDVQSRRLMRVLPTKTLQRWGKFQGLAVSPEGLLAVADFVSDEIAWIDVGTGTWLGITDAASLAHDHSQFLELTFSPDAGRLLATGHTSDTLAVFEVE